MGGRRDASATHSARLGNAADVDVFVTRCCSGDGRGVPQAHEGCVPSTHLALGRDGPHADRRHGERDLTSERSFR
jgi:hypothetical protein